MGRLRVAPSSRRYHHLVNYLVNSSSSLADSILKIRLAKSEVSFETSFAAVNAHLGRTKVRVRSTN